MKRAPWFSLFWAVTLVLLFLSQYGYCKKQETKTGTMVYAEFNGNRSDSILYFYLNDPNNSVFVLSPSSSPFTSCDQLPCLTAQTELLGLQVSCTRVSASPLCAATKDYPYTLGDHKGTPSITIGFGDMGWVEMNRSLTPSSELHDAFTNRLSVYDHDWKPTTANAWIDESAKLIQQFGRVQEEKSETQYSCLTHLKIGGPLSSLDECGASLDHTNSDLRGEQRIYSIAVWSGGMYVGYREVLVYVNKQEQTIDNVQWDDKIHTD
jgi:hypothetical protein